jgi:AraC-like DNA-binding protein
MLQSRIFSFDDPYHYQSAVRAANVEFLVTSGGAFKAELTQIDFDRLWIQRGYDSLPRIINAAHNPSRFPVMFRDNAEHSSLQLSGVDVMPGELVVFGKGATNHMRTSGPSLWAALSLTPEDLAAAGEAIAGRELTAPLDTCVLQPAAAPMARLKSLHRTADRLARTIPGMLARPAVAKALEQEMVRTMVVCLTGHLPVDTRTCSGRHAWVVRRFEDFLAARQYEPAYLAEICAALGVSERTLRTCCHEHLGMGPIRFLWLRRMHLAHRALLRGEPAAGATVTDTATNFGFWELGRFSVEYRALFGETPSASLRRPPQEAPLRKSRNSSAASDFS